MSWDERLFGHFYNKMQNAKNTLVTKLTKRTEFFLLTPERVLHLERFIDFHIGQKVRIIPSASIDCFFNGEDLFLQQKMEVSAAFFPFCLRYYELLGLLFTIPISADQDINQRLAFLSKHYPLFNRWVLNLQNELSELVKRPLSFYLDAASDSQHKENLNHLYAIKDENHSFNPEKDSCNEDSRVENSATVKMQREKKIKQIKALDSNSDDNPLVHAFEKVFTLDQYKGGNKKIDADDELIDHQAALKSLKVDHLIRSASNKTPTAYIDVDLTKNEMSLYEQAGDSKGYANAKVFLYKEWQSSQKKYRNDWVRLIEREKPLVDSVDDLLDLTKKWTASNGVKVGTIDLESLSTKENLVYKKILKNWHHLLNNRAPKRGLVNGKEIELDRGIDFLASLRSGYLLPEKFYQDVLLAQAQNSVLILVDQSLSTDVWLGDEKVLDLEIQALKIFIQLFKKQKVKFGAATFYSNTRKRVAFDWIKKIEKADRKKLCFLLEDFKPRGATRLGVIIRHGIKQFSRLNGDQGKKHILFLSDLKPTDFDFYEGSYGLSDFRQALREAKKQDIDFFLLGFTKDSHSKTKSYFSPHQYTYCSSSIELEMAIKKWLKFFVQHNKQRSVL